MINGVPSTIGVSGVGVKMRARVSVRVRVRVRTGLYGTTLDTS